MPWQQLILRVEAEELAAAEALLRLAGAEAISLYGEDDEELLEPEPGTTPMWGRVALHALFDAAADTRAVAGVLDSALGGKREISMLPLRDEDWSAALKTRFSVQRIGRLLLVPADQESQRGAPPTGVEERVPNPPRPARLKLSMGLAFGTGRHPTTRLCLEWLEQRLQRGAHVLDYGAGSGVLALAALVLGAERAWAVDIDPQALIATEDNAHLNGLAEAVWIGTPEAFEAGAAAHASVDVLIANILAGPLQSLASSFARYVKPGGTVVLSGLLETQCETIEAAFRPHFRGFERGLCEGWARLAGVRRTHA